MVLKLKISLTLSIALLLLSSVQITFAQYKFDLPKNTGYNSGYATVVGNQYIRIVSNTHKKEANLEFYDLKTGKLIKQRAFKPALLVESFYIGPDQTIWLFDESTGNLIKTEDSVYKEEIPILGNIPMPKSGYYPYTADMKWSPLHFHKNSFYFINSFDRSSQNPIRRVLDKEFIQSVDISTNKVKNNASIPWLFFERDYGMLNRFSSVRKDNIIIIAPNFSNELFLFNLENGNLISPILDTNNPYYHVAEPLVTKANFDISDISEQDWHAKTQRHHSTSNEYINILYDPYKKQYYRTLVVKGSKANAAGMKIIVLDDKFKFVKAHELSVDYKPDGMFVTEKGLNILNHRKYKADSDFLHFDTFKL